jgi:hypothetical protein
MGKVRSITRNRIHACRSQRMGIASGKKRAGLDRASFGVAGSSPVAPAHVSLLDQLQRAEPEGSHGDRSDLVQLLHGRSAGRVGTTIETIAVDSSLHDVPDAARMLVTASGFPADLPLRGSRDEHRRARPAGKGDPLLPDRGLADPGLPDGLFAARQGHLGSDSQTS